MAEVVGAVASVAQLVSLSGSLLARGYSFLGKVSRAPSEVRTLLTEAAAINSLLGQLQIVADADSKPVAPDDPLQALGRLGVFQECELILKSVQKALATCEQRHGKDVSNFGRRLIWPFKEKETKEALDRLHRMRGLLANAIDARSASSIRRIEATQGLVLGELSFLADTAKSQISTEETRSVIEWLCSQPSDGAQSSLETALSVRVPGTGTWVLSSTAYEKWMQTEVCTMWITGPPGSGKTLLSTTIIENLRLSHPPPKSAVLYFFCDHRDSSKRTAESFLVSIAKQLLDTSPECLSKAKELFDDNKKQGGRKLDRSRHIEAIRLLLENFDELFVVVDGLDEASEGEQIVDVLTNVHNLGLQKGKATKIILSSRYDIRLQRRSSRIVSVRLALEENMRPDIEHFINCELHNRVNRGTLKLRNKNLMFTIEHQIGLRAGTVLQARLQLDYLSTARTDKDIKTMLHNLPDGLEYTYESLLCSIASQHPTRLDDIRTLLKCLTTANLSASQIAEVMAMQPGERYLDFDAITTDPYDALEVVAPLVVLDRRDKGEEVVKLSHYSLEEFLCSEKIRHGPAKFFSVVPAEANAWLASICLQYLTFSVFDAPLDEDLDMNARTDYAFRRYAALNWYNHMSSAQHTLGSVDFYQPYLDWFTNSHEGPPCYKRWHDLFLEEFSVRMEFGHSPICFAIRTHLHDLFDYLVSHFHDLDYHFADGYTCLTVAAMMNDIRASHKLVEMGADIGIATLQRELTPLHLAAEFCSVETFNFLVRAGADIHARSYSETTPFYRACRGGNLSIIRTLKEHGADIDARTWDDWTPIYEAVGKGFENVVDLLLEWGADLTVINDDGFSPVALAIDLDDFSVAQKLHQANPNVISATDRTKLEAASK